MTFDIFRLLSRSKRNAQAQTRTQLIQHKNRKKAVFELFYAVSRCADLCTAGCVSIICIIVQRSVDFSVNTLE